MTCIENIFICMVSPLLVAALMAAGRLPALRPRQKGG